MVDEIVTAQDSGTGLQDTNDFNDAARFAQLAHDQNERDTVVDPPEASNQPRSFQLDVDFSSNILNISWGTAVLYQKSADTVDHTDDGGTPKQTIQNVMFCVQKPSSGDISLTADAVNYVYLGIDHSTNDRAIYKVNTTQSPPSDPYIKLGEIDTTANSVVELNRRPVGDYDTVYFHRPRTV